MTRPGECVRRATRILATALALSALAPAAARAQIYGYGGYGYGYGYGYAAAAYAYGFYANAYPTPIAPPFPAGYANPLFANGLTPLGVQAGLTDAYLMSSTRKPGPGAAYVPAVRQYGGTGSARPP